MISDWTIYAVHIGYGEWLCTDCACKELDRILGEDRTIDLSDARQLWLAGSPIKIDDNEERAIEPMISVEIDQFVGSDEVYCDHCSTILYNERERRTYRVEIAVTDNGDGLPDDDDFGIMVQEALAPAFENVTVDPIDDSEKLAVVLEGGLVQCVVTDSPALEGTSVLVIDFDADEEAEDAPEHVMMVENLDGLAGSEAWVHGEIVNKATIDLPAVRQWLEGKPVNQDDIDPEDLGATFDPDDLE